MLLWLPGLKYPVVSDTLVYVTLGKSVWQTGTYMLGGAPYAKHLPLHAIVTYPLVQLLGISFGMKLANLHDANFERDALKDVDWIYLNRIHEGSCMIENDIIEALSREKAPGLTWNPGGSHIEQGMNVADTKRLLSYTRLLLLNKEEALTFTKSQKVEDAVEKLLQAGVVICCITDGRHGARVWTRTEAWHCPGITTTHIEDTTGAGDAFGTAATWALLQGFDLPTMLRAGTINATSVLGSIGAEKGLLTDTEMHTRLKTLHLPVEPFSR
jgi:sugar/nucleoside kinase (ribokinase family)